MGVADFAFWHSSSIKKQEAQSEATEIVLEPKGTSVVARNHLGQDLYTLGIEGNGAFSMRDNDEHAVLRTVPDEKHPNTFKILDKQNRVIATSHETTFQWEAISITWSAKSLALITDATMVAYEDVAPTSPKEKKDEPLAELKMAQAKTAGYLQVPADIVSSSSFPPLGLFLFQAMILNRNYLHTNALQRLSLPTTIFRAASM